VDQLSSNESLNVTPTDEEVMKEWSKIKEKAPGEDEVRIIYIKEATGRVKKAVIDLIKKMFEDGKFCWDDTTRTGIMIPLFKKGDRQNPGNYRGICLLSMASRIIARIVATRLRNWAEGNGIMGENQNGFRSGRSTVDTVQILQRIEEECEKMVKHKEKFQRQDVSYPGAVLLDLRKAYPRVNREALWKILETYGLGGRIMKVLKMLHETTQYKVRGQKQDSSAWIPQRGLREGCPTSPILFNIFHQVVMDRAREERRRNAEGKGWNMGVKFNYIPGNLMMWQRRGKKNEESGAEWVVTELFADDTTIVGEEPELADGVRITKEVMARFEERTNDDKEESFTFGTVEARKTRILGSWMGEREDDGERIRKAQMAWAKIRHRLKGSKMNRKIQARIVEACVESIILYNCQGRVWYERNIKRMQSFMDRGYRHIWAYKKGLPLVKMQEKGVNMYDVRKELGIRSLKSKIEKRVLERMGHVLRMGKERTVRNVTVGWMEKVEGMKKSSASQRCTNQYWRKLIKEAGWTLGMIEVEARDRKAFKEKVTKRMKRIYRWEQDQEKKTNHEGNEEATTSSRKEEVPESLECRICGKVCKSKAGLAIHEKRIHKNREESVVFECEKCRKKFGQKANHLNHLKKCTGVVEGERKYRPRQKRCSGCGAMLSASNMARHKGRCE
jgi:hypothetical protein